MSFDLQAAVSLVSCVAALASVIVAWIVYRDQSSPDVVAYIDEASEGSHMAALFVENIGNAPAYDIVISAEGDLPVDDDDRKNLGKFMSHGISMLMPGSRRGTYLGWFDDLIEWEAKEPPAVSVSFASKRGGRVCKASFPVDPESFGAALVDCRSSAKSVEDLSKKVEGLTKEVSKVVQELKQSR